MTVTDMAAYRSMSDADKRAAAHRDALADPAVTGKELGERYGMSEEWGRKRARLARTGPKAVPVRKKASAAKPVHGPPAPKAAPPVRPERDAVPVPVPVERAAPSGRWVRVVQVAGVVVVAMVAAVISYTHMRHLALDAGEGWRADILPLSVDGMMVVASMNALERRRAGQKAWLAWAGLMLGLGASFAANVAAAQPTLQGRLVAAWPPVALLVALELLLHRGDDQ